jgi:hypothetical protein
MSILSWRVRRRTGSRRAMYRALAMHAMPRRGAVALELGRHGLEAALERGATGVRRCTREALERSLEAGGVPWP